MQNPLLDQFKNIVSSQWTSNEIIETYDDLSKRELFELTYHSCNSLSMRSVLISLVQDENRGGSRAIFFSSKRRDFLAIDGLEAALKVTAYSSEIDEATKILDIIQSSLTSRKQKFQSKEKDTKTQILKMILVERKIDECANLVMLKGSNRKIYFAIGDARESAAVVPLFMEAEGASLVQLALNKWMSEAQNLPPEQNFPESLVQGILKNLMQIKKWILNLITSYLDK